MGNVQIKFHFIKTVLQSDSAPVREDFKNIWKCIFLLLCHVHLAITCKQNPY